jgi:hypothetical protein
MGIFMIFWGIYGDFHDYFVDFWGFNDYLVDLWGFS